MPRLGKPRLGLLARISLMRICSRDFTCADMLARILYVRFCYVIFLIDCDMRFISFITNLNSLCLMRAILLFTFAQVLFRNELALFFTSEPEGRVEHQNEREGARLIL